MKTSLELSSRRLEVSRPGSIFSSPTTNTGTIEGQLYTYLRLLGKEPPMLYSYPH
jgi:hypothetical protein